MPRAALRTPPRPSPGDRVAIVSPSWAGPGAFPAVHELGMRRLRDDFGLEPVEYPTTRLLGASPAARAADLMAAFGDPSIRAVMATIGGDDQITVLRHLDPEVLGDPKPFFGYSDNTNLLNWLWSHGVVAYHGGSTMVHLGRGGAMHPTTADSLRRALFTAGEAPLHEVESFSEDEVGWASPDALTTAGPTQPADRWRWHNADRAVAGPTWGGNLEVLHWIAAAGRWIGPPEAYDGCILMVETSEEMPPATEVYRMLRNFGERGVLARFAGVVVGRPKAASREAPRTHGERARYRSDQQDAILRALSEYNPGAVVVFGVDIGHTDPQLVVPYGGLMRLDGPAGTIRAEY